MGGARTRVAEKTGDRERDDAGSSNVWTITGPRATVGGDEIEPGECKANWQSGQSASSTVSCVTPWCEATPS